MSTYCTSCKNPECPNHGKSIEMTNFTCGKYKGSTNYSRIVESKNADELVNLLLEAFDESLDCGIVSKEKLKEWLV